MTAPDPNAFLSRLERAGWFESLPAAAAELVRAVVLDAADQGLHPRVGLATVVVDSEYLLSEQPYSALLRQFAQASHGPFVPSSIEERLASDGTVLRFSSGGRVYQLQLPAEADEVPAGFYDGINRALEESESPLRFFEIKDLPWRPIPGFALTTRPAFERTVAANLVAVSEPSEDLTEQELEGYARSARKSTRKS